MLDSNRKGFAVMNEKLTSYSFADESLERCKRYCKEGSVIAEQIPYIYGYSIFISWHQFLKPIYLKNGQKNILWLHWSINKEYYQKTGKIVYRYTKP